jgi:long-chain acyl-CoA synthetase
MAIDAMVTEAVRRKVDGLTIPSLLQRNATEFGHLPAISMLGSDAPALTWAEVRERVAALARGLEEVGVRRDDRVLIMMSARPEHWLVDLAVVHLGAIPSTVYATLSPDQLRYLGAHSRAPVIVLEGAGQLARWSPILDSLPGIAKVVMLEEQPSRMDDPRFITLADVGATGAALHAADPDVFEKRWPEISPQQPVTVLYTSGTTGDPKGVAISHRNVIFQSAAVEATIPLPDHADSVSYLPLAHIAERVLGMYIPMYRAGHVHICADPTQILAALQQIRPAGFFGVPRVWEKIAAGLQGRMAAADENQRAALTAAMGVAVKAYQMREAGQPVPDDLAAELARWDAAALGPIRSMLGLDNVVWAGSGAAPIPVDVLLVLAGVGLDVLEVWGMTETTGSATINTPDRFRLGSVGYPNAGMEVRIADDGEILVRGDLVCLGYLAADGSIEPATDADGWLATGDVGTLDDDGFLTITDRKKELIITSQGKNIAPAAIENLLRRDPLVGYAVAIGDRRPYVTALIVLDEEMLPPWAARQGLGDLPYAELTAHPAVVAHVQSVVDAANEKLSRPEQVKYFAILPSGWTAETGELTPKLSLRRAVITDRYAAVIDTLYVDE